MMYKDAKDRDNVHTHARLRGRSVVLVSATRSFMNSNVLVHPRLLRLGKATSATHATQCACIAQVVTTQLVQNAL